MRISLACELGVHGDRRVDRAAPDAGKAEPLEPIVYTDQGPEPDSARGRGRGRRFRRQGARRSRS